MSNTVKIYMTLSTGVVGSTVKETLEVDRAEWNSMSEVEREQYVQDVYEQFVWDRNYGGVEVKE